MKTWLKTATLLINAAVFATAAHATEMTTLQGQVSFQQGDFHLISDNSNMILTGMSRDELNLYSGQSTIITGEVHRDEGDTDMMEVYKIQLEKQGELVTLYDWEVVNNELYEN